MGLLDQEADEDTVKEAAVRDHPQASCLRPFRLLSP
jgi:hypothetical protein